MTPVIFEIENYTLSAKCAKNHSVLHTKYNSHLLHLILKIINRTLDIILHFGGWQGFDVAKHLG